MQKIQLIIFLFLASIFLISACNRSDSSLEKDTVEEQQEEEIALKPVEPFDPASYTNAMMLEDYDFFWTTLEENCASLGLLEKKIEINLEEVREKYRTKVNALQDGDAEGFITIMGSLSSEFKSFAHIRTVNPVLYYRYMEDGSKNESIWESDTQKVLFQSTKVQAFYQWEKTLPLFQQMMKSAGETNTNSENDGKKAENSVIEENVQLSRQGDIAVIRLKTFLFYGNDTNQAVIEKLQNFCLENLDAQDFIVDITGNSGGSSLIWTEGLEPLWAGKTFTHEKMVAYKLGNINVQMWDGWPENDPDVDLKPISALNTADYPMLDAQSLEGCDGIAVKTVVNDYTDVKNPNGEEFQGRIWLLVDNINFSSAEMFVQFAKGNESIALVGKQTAGGGGGMTSPPNMDAAMPNSGMLFRFEPFYVLNANGTCNDLEGTYPDIEIDSDETPMQRCLEEIEKLQK